jgi:hypothetical protein
MTAKESIHRGFDKLQDFLLATHTGDELSSAELAEASGLSEQVCETVLEGLTRAGLMSREEDGRFVRRSLDLHGF